MFGTNDVRKTRTHMPAQTHSQQTSRFHFRNFVFTNQKHQPRPTQSIKVNFKYNNNNKNKRKHSPNSFCELPYTIR
jgi:hypothetical protein